jgi:hypothetical protein
MECIVERIERRRDRVPAAMQSSRAQAGIFFLQRRGIAQHVARELARRRRGDHFAAESALDQQRNASTVIEVRMGEQNEVDRCGIAAEVRRIAALDSVATLKKSAVDEHAPLGAFEQMTGSGDLARRAVACDRNHPTPPFITRARRDTLGCRPRLNLILVNRATRAVPKLYACIGRADRSATDIHRCSTSRTGPTTRSMSAITPRSHAR